MKKGIFLLLLIVLFSQIVSAEMSINNPKDAKYNLGMDIDTSVSITPDADISGLFKVSIKCQETELTYFVKPVSLKKEEQTTLAIPTLRTFEGLNNTCKLKAVVENYKGVLLESRSTDNFEQRRFSCTVYSYDGHFFLKT